MMIPIADETDWSVLNFNFWSVLCRVMIFGLAYAVEHLYESVEFKLHSTIIVLKEIICIGSHENNQFSRLPTFSPISYQLKD